MRTGRQSLLLNHLFNRLARLETMPRLLYPLDSFLRIVSNMRSGNDDLARYITDIEIAGCINGINGTHSDTGVAKIIHVKAAHWR